MKGKTEREHWSFVYFFCNLPLHVILNCFIQMLFYFSHGILQGFFFFRSWIMITFSYHLFCFYFEFLKKFQGNPQHHGSWSFFIVHLQVKLTL